MKRDLREELDAIRCPGQEGPRQRPLPYFSARGDDLHRPPRRTRANERIQVGIHRKGRMTRQVPSHWAIELRASKLPSPIGKALIDACQYQWTDSKCGGRTRQREVVFRCECIDARQRVMIRAAYSR